MTIKDYQSYFLAHIHRAPSGCWEWQGETNKDGYGVCYAPGWTGLPRHNLAHRVMWWFVHGKLPSALALHTCDNPRCVRPGHLVDGSQAENIRQCVARGRHASLRGGFNPAAKLTPQQVILIRGMEGRNTHIARLFSVSEATVRDIKTGRNWGRLGG